MGKSQEWKLALDQYIRQGDSGMAEKSAAWQTAIGLQDVDGLKISEYLLKIAKEHIEGRIDMNAAKTRIQTYYEKRKGHLYRCRREDTGGRPRFAAHRGIIGRENISAFTCILYQHS